jgi:beta-lactam-binding protein with PASTA domain
VISAAGATPGVVISYTMPPQQSTPVVDCVVPNVKGKTLAAARSAIRAAHCQLGKVTHAHSKTVKKGRVISQKPRKGLKLAKLSKVQLVISLGNHP